MRNKRKGILMASAILGSAAIVSTGFAAWVVTVNDNETVTGDIKVDTVNDNTHFITVLNSNKDLEIKFGTKSKADTATFDWLTNTNGLEADLLAHFEVEVTNYKSCDLKVDVDLPEAFTNAKSDATGKRLLADPELTCSQFVATSDGKAKVTFDLEFKWGEHFGGQNPIDFYNSHDALAKISGETTYAQDALQCLRTLEAFTTISDTETVYTQFSVSLVCTTDATNTGKVTDLYSAS